MHMYMSDVSTVTCTLLHVVLQDCIPFPVWVARPSWCTSACDWNIYVYMRLYKRQFLVQCSALNVAYEVFSFVTCWWALALGCCSYHCKQLVIGFLTSAFIAVWPKFWKHSRIQIYYTSWPTTAEISRVQCQGFHTVQQNSVAWLCGWMLVWLSHAADCNRVQWADGHLMRSIYVGFYLKVTTSYCCHGDTFGM